jgi:hypothetical protein
MTEIPLLAVPDGCTLPTAERPLRQTEFDAVLAHVRDVERGGPATLRLTLTGPPTLADDVRDLAAREMACCSFFTFTVTTPQPGEVLLEIQVPQAWARVLDAIADLARSGR